MFLRRGGDTGREASGFRVWAKTLEVWDLETGRALRTLRATLILSGRGGDAGREARSFRVWG